MSVVDILEMLAEGVPHEEIVADFPYVKLEDIRACLAYAGAALNGPGPDSAERISPGYYTPETLPPLSAGAAAILASVDAVAPPKAADSTGENAGGGGVRLGDVPFAPVKLDDEPLPGFDPDR